HAMTCETVSHSPAGSASPAPPSHPPRAGPPPRMEGRDSPSPRRRVAVGAGPGGRFMPPPRAGEGGRGRGSRLVVAGDLLELRFDVEVVGEPGRGDAVVAHLRRQLASVEAERGGRLRAIAVRLPQRLEDRLALDVGDDLLELA